MEKNIKLYRALWRVQRTMTTTYPVKITFGEVRDSGARDVLSTAATIAHSAGHCSPESGKDTPTGSNPAALIPDLGR